MLKSPLASDPEQVFRTVNSVYQQRFQLIWLPPIGFNDTFAMVVRGEDAQKLAQPAISAAQSRMWRLGVGYEFLTRPDGLKRLNSIYHLNWNGVARTMDLGLLYRALDQGQIDMAAANSTDGLLTSGRYSVLADDRQAFPPYQACFVVRRSVFSRHPGLRQALASLSGTIDDNTMRQLNRRVDIEHKPIVRVAADFLQELDRRKQ